MTFTFIDRACSDAYRLGVTTGGVGQHNLHTPGVTLGSQRGTVIATGVTGNAAITWNPTIDVPPARRRRRNTYTGTVTHSVA